MIDRWSKLVRDCRGATAIEYGLIAALICIAAIGALSGVNSRYGSMWSNLADRVPSQS